MNKFWQDFASDKKTVKMQPMTMNRAEKQPLCWQLVSSVNCPNSAAFWLPDVYKRQSKSINRLLDDIKNKKEQNLVETVSLRAMLLMKCGINTVKNIRVLVAGILVVK